MAKGEKKNEDTTEVALSQPQQPSQVESFIEKAIAANAPVETLERLFALHQKVNEDRAKAAFVQALAEFQKECPVIEKTKKVMERDSQKVRYMYAPIDSIVTQVREYVSKNGFSYRWETKQEGNKITAVCVLTHVLGHSESSGFTIESEASKFMSAPQSQASALTFAKRYTLCNVLGISTGEEDDDATTVNQTKGARNPRARIVFLLKRLKYETSDIEVVKEAVMKHAQLELEEKNFDEIIGRLEIVVKELEEYEKESNQTA